MQSYIFCALILSALCNIACGWQPSKIKQIESSPLSATAPKITALDEPCATTADGKCVPGLRWVTITEVGQKIPSDAVIIENIAKKRFAAVCRAPMKEPNGFDAWTPGTYDDLKKVCTIPYGGKVGKWAGKDFQVLAGDRNYWKWQKPGQPGGIVGGSELGGGRVFGICTPRYMQDYRKGDFLVFFGKDFGGNCMWADWKGDEITNEAEPSDGDVGYLVLARRDWRPL